MALPRLTDPRHVPIKNPNALQRLGLSLINDERDLPFLGLMASFSLVLIPCAIALFIPGVFRWWLGIPYIGLLFGAYFDRGILMLHNTSHRALFKPKLAFLNNYIPFILCPFYGQPPEAYYGHHIGMHHPENNLENDLSTTIPYQRDSFLHFLKYWAIFMTTTIFRLSSYLARHGKSKLAFKAVGGEFLYYVGCAIGLRYATNPTLCVFVIPYLMARFLMMWGNWGQHAFVDQEQPGNPLLNSITCVNTRYNRRCFNDGYHIGHHVRANRHWTDMPEDLEKNTERYAKANAIVFEGIDFFQVSLYLFLGRYDWLAKAFVELREEPRSEAEIVALLKSRLKPIIKRTEPATVAQAA